MDYSWLTTYYPLFLQGLEQTLLLLLLSGAIGMALAVPVGLAQVSGGFLSRHAAALFCALIRGTPLLVQIYILYYGLGDILGHMPEVRQSFLWPYLRDGFWYAVLAFALSTAAYEGEVIRGGLLAVPKGELEAARAYGMSPFTLVRRVWLPRALQITLPTLSGEAVLLLKSTPLASTVTVIDLLGAANRVRAETFHIYEPLLVAAVVYVAVSLVIARVFVLLERRIPTRHRPGAIF